MKFLQSLSAQVSLFTQGAILALGVVFILLDVITESLNPVIDLAWVTVLVCGLPLLINSVQSIWERLEIHANFLIVVAMVALISIGDYHTAAYVGLIVQGGFFLEQLITGESHYTVDDDMLPTMPAQLVAMRQGINNYSSVIVVAVLLLSMGSFALTQDFKHTVTLLLVLCPCSLELILVALMMGSISCIGAFKRNKAVSFRSTHRVHCIPYCHYRCRCIWFHRSCYGRCTARFGATWSRV